MMRNHGIVDRGRRSIAVDLKNPRGVETVLQLAERADILIERFRLGIMEKLGIGAAACHARIREDKVKIERLIHARVVHQADATE